MIGRLHRRHEFVEALRVLADDIVDGELILELGEVELVKIGDLSFLLGERDGGQHIGIVAVPHVRHGALFLVGDDLQFAGPVIFEAEIERTVLVDGIREVERRLLLIRGDLLGEHGLAVHIFEGIALDAVIHEERPFIREEIVEPFEDGTHLLFRLDAVGDDGISGRFFRIADMQLVARVLLGRRHGAKVIDILARRLIQRRIVGHQILIGMDVGVDHGEGRILGGRVLIGRKIEGIHRGHLRLLRLGALVVGVEVGVPGTLNLFLTDPIEKGGAGITTTISGFVVGTYWLLMLIGRLIGASLGAKVSSRSMMIFTSTVGLILVLCAIFSSANSLVNLPVLQQSATGGLSFGMAEVPINAMYLVLIGLCTSIMWGGIFNLAVEGLGKYLSAASGLFMVLVCGGGILPVIQGWLADIAGFMNSYWLIVIALGYLLFYGLVGCKNVNKDIVVD